MLFAQITDLHITTQVPSPLANRCPQTQLQKIITYLNTLANPPTFLFITGDCVHNGIADEYHILRELLSECTMPYYIIPGNHDSRTLLRQFFPALIQLSQDPHFIQYAIEDYPVRLIGIDSVKDHATEGELCPARLAWLDNTLREYPEKPTILFMHHPPLLYGIPAIDRYSYQHSEGFVRVLQQHPQVKHLFCGHTHRAMQSLWHDILVGVVGSTVAQFNIDHDATPQIKWSEEPGAFALHWWQTENKSLITQFCSLP